MAPYLNITSLTKSFGSQMIFKNLHIELALGGASAIFGRNGCGKTTLLRIIRGLLKEDGGDIKLSDIEQDVDTRAENPEIRLIEPMENGFWTDMRVIENLQYFYEEDEFSKQLEKVKSHLPIEPLLLKKYSDCSRGNKQLVHLVRGLMCSRAKLYLVDEPLSFLDPTVVQSVLSYFRLLQDQQKCILLSAQENYKEVLKDFSHFHLKDGTLT